MKKILTTIICLSLVLATVIFNDKVVELISGFITIREPIITEKVNKYKKEYSLSYVENTDTYIPYSNQDLMNILYSTINNGWDKFTFYCPSEYEDCLTDISNISQDSEILTHINNFVHPYNSFTNVRMTISNSGEINVIIDYLYEEKDIIKIDAEVDRLINELIEDNMTDTEKIRVIHDYIIDNTKYDVSVNKNENSPYKSEIAYGPLFDGYAICNGYTDLMAIFLTKFDIKNIKVATTPGEISYSTTGHVWNSVYLDNKWLHLDLTWDDPSDPDDLEENYLTHDYFLINTTEITEIDSKDTNNIIEEHNFNKVIYYEIK